MVLDPHQKGKDGPPALPFSIIDLIQGQVPLGMGEGAPWGMGRTLTELGDSESLTVKPERVSVGIQATGFGWSDVVGPDYLKTLQLPWVQSSLHQPPEWDSSLCLFFFFF